MSKHHIAADPIETLHRRLMASPQNFAHVLDFVFAGIGWSNPGQWDCEIYFDIPRKMFGFGDERRPGDVDMLIVPCSGSRRFWQEATAVEVKCYGLPRERRQKSVGDTGRVQVIGLAEMGFPFLGLLHVVPVEAGAGAEIVDLPLWELEKPYPPNAPPERYVPTDVSAMTFFFRQRGRLERSNLPECAGVKVSALTLNASRQVIGTSVGYERRPTRNSSVSNDLIERLPAVVRGLEGIRVGYPQPRFRVRSTRRSSRPLTPP